MNDEEQLLRATLARAAAMVGQDAASFHRLSAARGGTLSAESFVLGMGAAAFAMMGVDLVHIAEAHGELLDVFVKDASARLDAGAN